MQMTQFFSLNPCRTRKEDVSEEKQRKPKLISKCKENKKKLKLTGQQKVHSLLYTMMKLKKPNNLNTWDH